MSVRGLLAGLMLATFATPAAAQTATGPKATVLVFARGGADGLTAGRIERDLRNLFDASAVLDPTRPTSLSIEHRYDVGRLSKADLETARRHFNEAQRGLVKGDPDEAKEQLFRAERFYNKGIPYASDPGLLRGIYYYYYLVRLAAGLESEAREAYCAYAALTRNLAGSAGPMEQFEPLADKCGEAAVAGTAELRISAEVDGAHAFVDDRNVGVIGRTAAYVDPFLAAGPHLVEVRKAGYARWGTLVNLKNGSSETLNVKLAVAKNRKEEFDPLADLVFEGKDASSDDYITDLLFETAERFGVSVLISAYLEPSAGGQSRLTLFTYADGTLDKRLYRVPMAVDAHHATLREFFKERFGVDLDPARAQPGTGRFAPTLFRVE